MSDTVHTVDELVSYIKKSNYFKKYGQTENMIVDGLTIFPIMVFPDSIDMRLILEATEKSANLLALFMHSFAFLALFKVKNNSVQFNIALH